MPDDLANQLAALWVIAAAGAGLTGAVLALLRPFLPAEVELEKQVKFARESLIAKLGNQLENVLVSHAAQILVQMPNEAPQPGAARPTATTVEEFAAECFRGVGAHAELKRLFRSLTRAHHALFWSVGVAVACLFVGALLEAVRPYVVLIAIGDIVVQFALVRHLRLIVNEFRERADGI